MLGIPSARAAVRSPVVRLAELLLFYFVVPALPLFGVPGIVYGTIFAATLIVLMLIALENRRRAKKPKAGPTPMDASARNIVARDPVRRPHVPGDLPRLVAVFSLFVAISTLGVWRLRPEQLFSAPRQAPGLWLLFWLIYSLGSVAPQEAIFRVVFFSRYAGLWGGRRIPGVLINAASFSLAHALMGHPVVYLLTFCGGIIFAQHWLREKNFLSLCLLHTAYGFWLFTVGLGPVFGFPF